YSDNFALRAVKYWEPVGLVALNYYHNRIRNGIVARNLSAQEFGYSGDQYADATFSTSANQSDRAISVDAWQLEFNHAMDYLPGVLRGLTVRGAYMYANPSEPLPRVASQVAQFGVGWKYGRVRLSLNSVYSNEKDRGQTGNIATPGGTITQSQPFIPYAEVNLSGSYTFIRKTRDNVLGLEAFFSVNNLLRRHRGTWYANDEIWPGSSGHHSQIDIYSGQKASIGIRARF
ncbi:MAG: TonB-dependent receptor, partial [Stenotrophomonas sp.]|nr:TonB-dependent receptor [Stenotrophomonas sp.]